MKDVIIACDFANKEATLRFLRLFEGKKPYVKIGMELFYGEGPKLVEEIKHMGHPVFLDLKLHDIPNTVKKAMTNIAKLGVDMTNVHAAGSCAMMEAAQEGLLIGGGANAALIAVTILTSISAQTLHDELLVQQQLAETVMHYAQNAKQAGLSGVVCSPLESLAVKAACGQGFLTITPGIRYPDGELNDQARITTPQKARALQADYIVVGRPITASADPVAAYERIVTDFLQEG